VHLPLSVFRGKTGTEIVHWYTGDMAAPAASINFMARGYRPTFSRGQLNGAPVFVTCMYYRGGSIYRRYRHIGIGIVSAV